jgi:peptidyl-prolyl cis-trans isomerase SurA
MRRAGGLLLVVAAAVCFTAEIVDRVVAVVGDEVITYRELDQAYVNDTLGLMQPEPMSGETSSFVSREDYLDKMIERRLIAQEVKRQGIQVDALEVEQAVDRKRESLGLSEDEFTRALAREGITMDQYREQVKEQLITFRLISQEVRGEIDITDEEINAYYLQHPERFYKKDSYHLFHIFIAFAPNSGAPGREAAVAKLEQIREAVANGASFEDMARKHSQSPTADAGGDLGWFAHNELLPAFQAQVKGMAVGQMSPVFVHEGGAHLILVKESRGGEAVAFDQVKDEIRDILFQEEAMERYDLWLGRLKARSYTENRLK